MFDYERFIANLEQRHLEFGQKITALHKQYEDEETQAFERSVLQDLKRLPTFDA